MHVYTCKINQQPVLLSRNENIEGCQEHFRYISAQDVQSKKVSGSGFLRVYVFTGQTK